MIPDSTADTTRISMTANSGVTSGGGGDHPASRSMHAGLDQGADHDEQPGEEQQGLPLHAAM